MADDQSNPPAGPASPVQAGPLRPGAPAAAASADPGPARRKMRGRLFRILAVSVVIGAAIWFGYGALTSHTVSTDDAYVGADVAQITPQINGTVREVRVEDTQVVRRGDVLVLIDSADTTAAAAQSRADYARSIRRVKQYFANNESGAAAVTARQADLARAKAQLISAQSEVQRTRIDLQRRQALAASGAVSGEELTTAQNASRIAGANLEAAAATEKQAEANIGAAQAQEASQVALTAGAGVDDNPEVAAAKAQLDAAELNLSRTVIRAPIGGVVTRRQVQVGQRVPVGAQLMTVAPTDQVYVDANFKEVQLRHVCVGQPVTLTSDLYGHGVTYHGRVVGLSGGTGSAFALIPAQNATGNWIKVVQRLPVRVSLDPREVRAHPLKVGLSMSTGIDVAAACEHPVGAAPASR